MTLLHKWLTNFFMTFNNIFALYSKHFCSWGGWKPTHLASIFSLRMSVTLPHGTMLMAFADVKYGCLLMLVDRLVSTHPCSWPYYNFELMPNDQVYAMPWHSACVLYVCILQSPCVILSTFITGLCNTMSMGLLYKKIVRLEVTHCLSRWSDIFNLYC
jgi:hypothetical protein